MTVMVVGTKGGNMEKQDCICRVIGFCFAPTDELCILYLSAKLHGMPLPCEHAVAGEVDLYSGVPWEILPDDDPHWLQTESASSKDRSKDKIKIKKTIYVFTKLYNLATKSDDGNKKVRTAGSGTWWSQHNDPVMNQGKIIGRNRYFRFSPERGKKSKRKISGDQDNWTMHEYTLEGVDQKFKNYALCKITNEVTMVKKQCLTATTASNLQIAGGYLNENQRQNLVYSGPDQEAVIKDSVPVLNVHNCQPTSTALTVAGGKNSDHPHLAYVTDYEVHHYQSSFNAGPAASSLDSNNVHNYKSSLEAELEDLPPTFDDNIDMGFLDNIEIPVEQDPQVPINLEKTNNQVGSEVVQELPVVANDQRNDLGDGDQEEVNTQIQEINLHDYMPSFDGEFGADNWSIPDYNFQWDDSQDSIDIDSLWNF